MTRRRVLIVEDQGITAIDEAQIMSNLGYEVTGIALSGEDAIEQAGRYRPDVILMDIGLDGDMDGREAALEIQRLYQIPVVYVTAYGSKEASKSLKTAPPEGIGYIVKPYTVKELRSEIERIIG